MESMWLADGWAPGKEELTSTDSSSSPKRHPSKPFIRPPGQTHLAHPRNGVCCVCSPFYCASSSSVDVLARESAQDPVERGRDSTRAGAARSSGGLQHRSQGRPLGQPTRCIDGRLTSRSRWRCGVRAPVLHASQPQGVRPLGELTSSGASLPKHARSRLTRWINPFCSPLSASPLTRTSDLSVCSSPPRTPRRQCG